MGKYLIHRTASGFKFNLLAANGQIIAASEVYDSLAACRKGCRSVQLCAPGAKLVDLTLAQQATNPKFELYQDRAGEYRFRLKARNGQIIAVSEGYRARTSCEKGIESVRQNADSPIVTAD